MATEADLLLSGGTVVVDSQHVIRDGAVAIQGDRIVRVGAAADVVHEVHAKRVIDCAGKAVMPGLIDAHNHTCQSTARGLADDLPVTDWLNRVIGFEAALDDEDVAASVRLACVEMIRGGTTGVMEGCAPPDYVDIVGDVFAESGLRCVLTRSTMEKPDPTWNVPRSFLRDAETNLRETRQMLKKWHGANGGLIHAWPSYRHAQDVSAELVVDLCRLIDEFEVGLHGHQSTRRFGEIEFLDELGVLRPEMVFAHAIRYSRREMELIKAHGIKLNHNPGASMHGAYGASTLGHYPELVAMGVCVAIGADGAANNNTLDMFREMRLAATVHKEARMNPTVIPARIAFDMATVNGAIACRWPDVGRVSAGSKADLIVVNVLRPHLVPHHDLVSNLVYCANGHDVEMTIVSGNVLMEDGVIKVFDEAKVIRDAMASADRVLQRWHP